MTNSPDTTNPILAAWLRPSVPDGERTIEELCREWRLVDAKMAYDLALIPNDDDGDELIAAAYRRRGEIEEALGARVPETADDCRMVLDLVLRVLSDDAIVAEGEMQLIRSVHAGLNHVRNEAERRTA